MEEFFRQIIFFSEIVMVMITRDWLVIYKSDSHFVVVRFWNHSYDYRPNLIPLVPITIMDQNYKNILEDDWLSPDLFEKW